MLDAARQSEQRQLLQSCSTLSPLRRGPRSLRCGCRKRVNKLERCRVARFAILLTESVTVRQYARIAHPLGTQGSHRECLAPGRDIKRNRRVSAPAGTGFAIFDAE